MTSSKKAYEIFSNKASNKTNKKLSNKMLKEAKEICNEISSKFKTTGEYMFSLQMPYSKHNKKNKQKALTSIRKVFSCSSKVRADKEEFEFNLQDYEI